MNPDQERIRNEMQLIAQLVKERLAAKTAFVVLAGDSGEGGLMQYVSNCLRLDAMQLMREFISTVEDRDYARDRKVGETENEQEFSVWWNMQLSRWGDEHHSSKLRSWCWDAWCAARQT